ncbi:DUF3662 and FHA domain-containing protein [Tomitella gaofuii]|uniref:DUF3662 and FHA domain-containing protein n=1 Tax=Tomitella gaofuii TaxID=2760083 RepID=UPI0015F8A5A6|nr:DUF3662 and FHA domain-containing protein [Tomitella gaofuii]
MGFVQRFERRLEGAVDDAFARVFGGKIMPAEVEAALRREASDGLRMQGDQPVAPNHYVLTVSDSDEQNLTADAELTLRSFATHLAGFIDEQRWQTYGDVSVELQSSPNLHTGQFRAQSSINPDAGLSVSSDPVPGQAPQRGAASAQRPQPPRDEPGAPDGGLPSERYRARSEGRLTASPAPPPGAASARRGEAPGAGQQPPHELAERGDRPAAYGGEAYSAWGAPGYGRDRAPAPDAPPAPYYGQDRAAGRPDAGQDVPGRESGGRQYGDRPVYPPSDYGPQDYAAQDHGPHGYGAPGYGDRSQPPQGHGPGGYGSGGYGPGGYGQEGYAPQGFGSQDYASPGYASQDYASPDYDPRAHGRPEPDARTGYPPQDHTQGYPQQDDPQTGGYGAWSQPRTHGVRLVLDDGSGRTFDLRQGSNVIGRGQASHFRVPDTGVSRQHADIQWDGAVALLVDLGSTNGTVVNGNPVTEWQLAHGDIIRVGHTDIAVQFR